MYVCSFLIYMGLVSKIQLSYLAPISTGVVYVLTLAAALFILSILPLPLGHIHHTLQGVAYLIGAGAYIAELVEMSDEEKRASKHHRRRIFMPNLFGLLYIILGISHLFD